MKKKDFGKAFASLDAFLARNPSSMAGCYQIGRLAALSGERLDQGEQCMKRYLEYEPTEDEPPHRWTYVRLGQIYEHKGDRTAARRAYEEALKLDKNLKEAREALKRLS